MFLERMEECVRVYLSPLFLQDTMGGERVEVPLTVHEQSVLTDGLELW